MKKGILASSGTRYAAGCHRTRLGLGSPRHWVRLGMTAVEIVIGIRGGRRRAKAVVVAIVIGKGWEWGRLLSSLPWERLRLEGHHHWEKLGLGEGLSSSSSSCEAELDHRAKLG